MKQLMEHNQQVEKENRQLLDAIQAVSFTVTTTILLFHSKYHGYRPPRTFKQYLYSIVVLFHVFDLVERRHRRQRITSEGAKF